MSMVTKFLQSDDLATMFTTPRWVCNWSWMQTFEPPSVLYNTFWHGFCNIFNVNICPFRFECVANKSRSAIISYIQICTYRRIRSFIPLCIPVNLSCKVQSWPKLLDNNYEAMTLSLNIMWHFKCKIYWGVI